MDGSYNRFSIQKKTNQIFHAELNVCGDKMVSYKKTYG